LSLDCDVQDRKRLVNRKAMAFRLLGFNTID
jgi:hypothetical protein